MLIIQSVVTCPATSSPFPPNPTHTKSEGEKDFLLQNYPMPSDFLIKVGVRMQLPILYNEELPVQISVDHALPVQDKHAQTLSINFLLSSPHKSKNTVFQAVVQI